MKIEYRTRVVKFDGNKGFEDQQLKDVTDTGYDDDSFDVFAVFPLGDDRWRLFMRREKRRG